MTILEGPYRPARRHRRPEGTGPIVWLFTGSGLTLVVLGYVFADPIARWLAS